VETMPVLTLLGAANAACGFGSHRRPSLKETQSRSTDETSACADKHFQSRESGYRHSAMCLLRKADCFEISNLVGDRSFDGQAFHR
jgi:hypothetical protein